MGAIGTPITPSIPPVGSAGPQFATDINAILTEVVNRLSAKVPLSSISVGTSFDLQGAQLLNAAYVTLVNSAVTPPSSPVNRLTTFSGDLYYVGPSGAVQITSGALLNAAAIGGITGAYGGANPAQFRYDNVNSRYDAYADFAGARWADVRALGFDIAAGSTSAVFARLLFGGSVNKIYTLPTTAATTADARPLYMDSTGQITVGHGTKNYTYSSQGASTVTTIGNSNIVTDHAGGLFTLTNTASSASKGVDNLLEKFVISSITFMFNKPLAGVCTLALKKAKNGVITTLATTTNNVLGFQTVTINLGAAETVESTANYSAVFTYSTTNATAEVWYGFVITGTLPA